MSNKLITPNETDGDRNIRYGETQLPASTTFSKGNNRHRAIIGACMFLSLGVLGVSCLDLTHLISSDGILDPNLNVTTVSKLPDLPFPISYYRRFDKATLLPVCEITLSGKRFGFANREGKIVVPPQFSDVGNFSEGLASFASGKDSALKWGFINSLGKVVIPAKYSSVGSFHSGVAFVEVDREWRLIDATGTLISATKLTNQPYWTGRGFIAEETSLRSGFLNLKGKYDLPPEYSRIAPLFESQTDSRINGFGREDYSEENYRDGMPVYRNAKYFLIGKDGRYGVADGVGNIILKPQFDDISSFNKGHAAVVVKRLLGFANTTGEIIIKPQFYSVSPFDALIAVRDSSSSAYRLIDSRGNPVSGKSFEDIVTERGQWLSEGLAAYGADGKYGYFDSKGRVAIPPKFEFARPFQKGFAVVRFNGVWRYIDKAGRFASPIEFASAANLSEDGAKVVIAGPLYRFIENGSSSVRMLRSGRGLTIKE